MTVASQSRNRNLKRTTPHTVQDVTRGQLQGFSTVQQEKGGRTPTPATQDGSYSVILPLARTPV
jgi:hypothetical protein